MSTSAETKIIQYLHEAHALETAVANALVGHIAMTPAGSYRTGLEHHLRETRRHATLVQRRLVELDAGRSLLQAGYGLANSLVIQALAISLVPISILRGASPEERLVKNAKDEYEVEAQEIATYQALEVLATAVGDDVTAELAATIRADEERMRARLEEELPRLVTDMVRAELGDDPRFQLSRIGAIDAARTVAGAAARTAASTARSAARRGDRAATSVEQAPPVRRSKPAATRTKSGTKATSAKSRTTSRKPAATKAATKPRPKAPSKR